MLPNDQLLQQAPAAAQTSLTAFGTVFTTVTWVLLIAINLWCLRKLFRNQPEPDPTAEVAPASSEVVAPATVRPDERTTERELPAAGTRQAAARTAAAP